MTMRYQELIAVLQRARALVLVEGNDFSWSGWENEAAAVEEIDGLIATLQADALPDTLSLSVLFAPTGPMQETSMSSGWADAFLALADSFDAEMAKLGLE